MTHVTRIAGLALALPLLAGCGAAATSTDRVADDKPVVQTVSRQEDGDAFVAKLRTAVEGITTTRFDVRLTGDLEATATGAADLTTTPPTVELTPERPLFGVAEVRLVDGVGYVRYEGAWYRADLGTYLSMIGGLDLTDLDLEALADTLAGVLTDVDVTGDTGEEVWHATVDGARLVDELAPDDPGAHAYLGSGTATITATFTGDRLDAVVVDLDDITVEVTLTDQGDPVSVEAPRGATSLGTLGWSATTEIAPGG